LCLLGNAGQSCSSTVCTTSSWLQNCQTCQTLHVKLKLTSSLSCSNQWTCSLFNDTSEPRLTSSGNRGDWNVETNNLVNFLGASNSFSLNPDVIMWRHRLINSFPVSLCSHQREDVCGVGFESLYSKRDQHLISLYNFNRMSRCR